MPAERPVPIWKPMPDLGAKSASDAVRRAGHRLRLFTDAYEGRDIKPAQEGYLQSGDLYDSPVRVLIKDLNMARGYKIVLGQDGIDTVVPVQSPSLPDLIKSQAEIIDRGGFVPTPLRTRRG
jgi:hypothetical protein